MRSWPLALLVLTLALPASAGDAFAPCAACHSLVAGDNRTGPSLAGVLGRPAGSQPGYRYSNAMRGSGIRWDAAVLDRFLADPQAVVPGNRMPFAGLASAAERQAVLGVLGKAASSPP